MNNDVTNYINVLDSWKQKICNSLRNLIFQEIPDIEEKLQYKKPHYLKNKKYVCVITPAKDYISFTIFNAENIEADFFEKGVPERKTVKIKKDQKIDYKVLAALFKKASNNI